MRPGRKTEPTSVPDATQLAHAIGPVLAAACANSPIVGGRPSRWRSARLAVWAAIDRTRTAPACTSGLAIGDDAAESTASPSDQWAQYALGARVMLVRAGPGRFVPVFEHLTFEEWMSRGHELGYPTEEEEVSIVVAQRHGHPLTALGPASVSAQPS